MARRGLDIGALAGHAPRQRYYGWTIVHALGLAQLISWGIIYYGFGALLAPMQADLGWSQSQLTGAFSLALATGGLAALPAGWLVDQYGARWMMAAGSLLATLLVVAWAHVSSIAQLYALWAGLGVAMALVLYEPAFAVITVWFVRQRSRALTILTIWGGLASVVMVPLTTLLEAHYGWRGALLALAALLGLVTLPLHALVLRRRPEDHGWLPDGAQAPPPEQASLAVPQAQLSLRQALGGAAFWWLAGAFTLSTSATIAINVHLLSYLAQAGHSLALAAFAAGLIGAAQIPSRLLIALLGARIAQSRLAVLLTLVQALAVALLIMVPGQLGVLAFAALFGAGSGALTPTRAALVAEIYGSAAYGRISGMIALLSTAGRALAPLGASVIVAWGGGYSALLWLLALLALSSAGATAIGWTLRPARQ